MRAHPGTVDPHAQRPGHLRDHRPLGGLCDPVPGHAPADRHEGAGRAARAHPPLPGALCPARREPGRRRRAHRAAPCPAHPGARRHLHPQRRQPLAPEPGGHLRPPGRARGRLQPQRLRGAALGRLPRAPRTMPPAAARRPPSSGRGWRSTGPGSARRRGRRGRDRRTPWPGTAIGPQHPVRGRPARGHRIADPRYTGPVRQESSPSSDPKHPLPPRPAPRLAAVLASVSSCSSCATPRRQTPGADGPWAGRPIGAATRTQPRPQAGHDLRAPPASGSSSAARRWSSRGARRASPTSGPGRTTTHATAAGSTPTGARPASRGLDGMDCRQPWSAAFVSWVMQGAGVPGEPVPAGPRPLGLPGRASSTSRTTRGAGSSPGGWRTTARTPATWSAPPAARSRPATYDGYTSAWALEGASTHCDLVVAKNGQTLEVIGGNVRNSVSKSTLELDGTGPPAARAAATLVPDPGEPAVGLE